MTDRPDVSPPPIARALGAWSGAGSRDVGLAGLGCPVVAVRTPRGVEIRSGGTMHWGRGPRPDEHAALAYVPSLLPMDLGSPEFRRDHGVVGAFVGGSMANAIASEELVEALVRSGLLAYFGAGGPGLPRIEAAIDRLGRNLPGGSWGLNLIHSPSEPAFEDATVELYLRRGIGRIEASAFLDLSPAVVRYRVAGLRELPDGSVEIGHRVMAKVSREEVARRFLGPAPERLVRELLAAGRITESQARLSAHVPMCDDLTAEADSGGHTDNRPLVLLLPRLITLRDELVAARPLLRVPRIGAAGGIGTPAAAAAAFGLGAAYVVGGSVLQACVESGTSGLTRAMLADAAPTDVTMAPAADMFELGVSLQVLSRGTLFPVRARKLYQWYREYGGVDDLPAAVRAELEGTYFRESLESAWRGCERFWQDRDAAQVQRAASDPKHRLALLFRSYLGQSSRWANEGLADRKADFQVWCGPAMGAFNDWVRGTALARVEERKAEAVAWNILAGAAFLSRTAALRGQGVAGAVLSAPGAVDLAGIRAARAQWQEVARDPAGDEPKAEHPPARGQAAQPIAIVGLGALFPKANGLGGFWRLVRTGLDAVGEIPATHWSVEDYHDPDPAAPDRTYGRRGAFLDPQPFDPSAFGIPPSILEATDTAQLLALGVADEALKDAGCEPGGTWDRARTACILGVTGTQELVVTLGSRLGFPQWRRGLAEVGIEGEEADRAVEAIGRQWVQWQENSFPGLLGNVVAGRIANRFDLGGTNCVTDAACASSLAAVHLACLELQCGRADRVLTGGVDALNDIFMHMCFSKTPALSPTGDAKPFAADADGTILGEGLGMLVLRRLADAERDGDRVYAVIDGVGTGSDGRARSIYAPLPDGQARALSNAYDVAGVEPSAIGLVEAHGTGTKAGDGAEVEALERVFAGAPRGSVTLGSIKSQIGHTKAAAGAAGLLKAALALHHRVLPPTCKVDPQTSRIRPETGPFRLLTRARPWVRHGEHPRRAAVSSFGFGGSDFHAVLGEHRSSTTAPAWDGAVQLLAFSGATDAAVLASMEELKSALAAAQQRGGTAGPVLAGRVLRAEARRSRDRFRPEAAVRVVLVCVSGEDAETRLALAAERLRAGDDTRAPAAAQVHIGRGPASGKTALLFPGQGSQYPSMFQGAACVFPEFLDLAEAGGELGTRVAEAIWPGEAASEVERAAQRDRLRATSMAQPALALVEAAWVAILRRFGVRWDLCAGHSFGELAALHAAGAIDSRSLLRLGHARGLAMEELPGDRGTMMAVFAPLDAVQGMLEAEGLDAVLANRNTDDQGVLSGSHRAISAAETRCSARGWRTTRLDVAAAFHSPLVADAAAVFEGVLATVDVRAPAKPTWANVDAAPHPPGGVEIRARLTQQIGAPVRWVETIRSMAEAGATTWVEVGPKSVLSAMVRRVVPGALAVAVDAGSDAEDPVLSIAGLLARLAAAGRVDHLSQWDAGAPSETPLPRLVVPLSGANHRAPQPSPPAKSRPMAPSRPSAPLSAPTTATFRGGDAPGGAAPPGEGQDPAGLLALWGRTQEGLRGILELQQQNAAAHRAFLDQQAEVQRALHTLIHNQQQLLAGVMGPGHEVTLSALMVRTEAAPQAPIHAATQAQAQAQAQAQPSPPAEAPRPGRGSPTPALPTITPAAAPSPVAAATAKARSALPVLVDVVSQCTGYPPEMIGADLDLEADLGIDSIKRVEILSLYAERVPGAPQVEPEALSRLRTLRQVATFVEGGEAEVPSPSSTPPSAAGPVHRERALPAQDLVAVLLDVVATATGYPPDMLGLDLDMEADLGIDSIKRVEILSLVSERAPGVPSVEPERLSTLRTLRQVATFLRGAGEDAASTASAAPGRDRNTGLESSPIAAPQPPPAPILDGEAGAGPLPRRTLRAERAPLPAGQGAGVRGAVVLVGDASPTREALRRAVERRGGTTLLVEAGADPGPMPPGLAGLIFVEADAGAPPVGSTLAVLQAAGGIWSTARDDRPFLVGVVGGDGLYGLQGEPPSAHGAEICGLIKTAAQEWPHVACSVWARPAGVDPDTLAEAALAARVGTDLEWAMDASGAVRRLVLVDDAGEDGPWPLSPGELVVISGGARGVTAACAVAIARRHMGPMLLLGRTPEPAEEPDWLAAARDEVAIKRALAGRSSGPKGPREIGAATARVLAEREVRATLAALRAVGSQVHYAAVDVEDVAAVRAAVAEAVGRFGSVRALVHGAGVLRDKRLEDKDLGAFREVWGPKVFGLDNLIAAVRPEELRVLCAFTSVSGRFGRRGQCDYAAANQQLVFALERFASRWPACVVSALSWGPWEGGMVGPALAREFHREGVELIGLSRGAAQCVRELATRGPVERVLGELGHAFRAAPGASSGLSRAVPEAESDAGQWRFALNTEALGWLADHRLRGRPVLPAAMMLEAFAAAAGPGRPVLRGFAVLHGLVLDGTDADVDVRWTREDKGLSLQLHGPGDVLVARAEALEANGVDTRPAAALLEPEGPLYPVGLDDCYGRRLFHGPSLRVLSDLCSCDEAGIRVEMRAGTLGERSDLRAGPWSFDPGLIDGVFQAAILWCWEQRGAPSLPNRIERFVRWENPRAGERVSADLRYRSGTTSPVFDVELRGADGRALARIEGYRCTVSAQLVSAFQPAVDEGAAPGL